MTLSSIGSQDFASVAVAIASAVDVLAWLLAALSLRLLRRRGVVVDRRWQTAGAVGWALVWAAIAVGVVLLVGGSPRAPARRRRARRRGRRGGVDRDGAPAVVGRRRCWRSSGWRWCWRAVLGAGAMRRPASAACARAVGRPARPPGSWSGRSSPSLVGVAAIADPIGLLEPLDRRSAASGWCCSRSSRSGGLSAAARGDRAGPTTDRAPDATAAIAWRSPSLAVVVAVVVAGVVVLARPGRDVEDEVVAAGDGRRSATVTPSCAIDRSTRSPTSPRTTPCRSPANPAGSSPSRSIRSRSSSTRACGRCSIDVWSGHPGRRRRAHGARQLRRGAARSPRPSSGPRSSTPRCASPTRSPARPHGHRGAVPVPRPVRDRVDAVARHARRAARLAGDQPRRGRHACSSRITSTPR